MRFKIYSLYVSRLNCTWGKFKHRGTRHQKKRWSLAVYFVYRILIFRFLKILFWYCFILVFCFLGTFWELGAKLYTIKISQSCSNKIIWQVDWFFGHSFRISKARKVGTSTCLINRTENKIIRLLNFLNNNVDSWISRRNENPVSGNRWRPKLLTAANG